MTTELLEQPTETPASSSDAPPSTGAPASIAPAPAAPESPVDNAPIRDADGKFAADPMEKFLAKARAISERTIERINSESAEKAGDATQATQPTDAQSPPADPVAASNEGPSAEMLAIAKRLGVPQQALELATSDDHLRIAIAMMPPANEPTAEEQEPPSLPQQQPAAPALPDEFLFKNLLPEDYVDADDPLRQQINHFIERGGEMQQVVATLATKVLELEKERSTWQEQREAEQATQLQSKFDSVLDESGWAEVGKRSDLKAGSREAYARQVLYGEFQLLSANLQGMAPERIAELAYEKVFNRRPTPKQTPKEAAKQQAIIDQSNRRLGGGYVGPASPEPELSEEERYRRMVAGIVRR